MTADEKKQLDKLIELTNILKKENETFRQSMLELVKRINEKVDQKHVPVTLEGNILSTAQEAIQKAIQTTLTSHNSPLLELVKSVVNENSVFLRSVISESFTEVIKTDNFRQSIIDAFSHKVAKTIISNNDGLFDKVSNELKADAIFKGKMITAVANVVEECLKERK